MTTAASLPRDMPSLTCAALVRPGSDLERRIHRRKHRGCGCAPAPAWGIYELQRAFAPAHNLGLGDGSWITPEESDLRDLILVPQVDAKAVGVLFDGC